MDRDASVPPRDDQPTDPRSVHDERGVDRSQIRAFLRLAPRERLDRVSRQVAFFLRVRRRHARP